MINSRVFLRKFLRFQRDILICKPRISFHCETETLGIRDGAKTIVKTGGHLRILSGGAGENISWESEMLKQKNCEIILLDPTPRSILHVKMYLESIEYRQRKQTSRLEFFPLALWDTSDELEMFAPKDSHHNDFSIVDLQNTAQFQSGIQVQTTTVKEMLDRFSWEVIDILKIDIEGASLSVLRKMFEDYIFPKQILIEIDELFFPSIRNLNSARKVFKLLRKQGYELAYEKYFDFTFYKN